MYLTFTHDDMDARRALKRGEQRGRQAVRAAMFMVGQDLADAALRQTPSRTGELRRSVFVSRSWPVRVGFGAWYAAIVHERLARHPIGRWKYLEHALSALASGGATWVSYFEQAFVKGLTIRTAPARHPTKPPGGPKKAKTARPTGRR